MLVSLEREISQALFSCAERTLILKAYSAPPPIFPLSHMMPVIPLTLLKGFIIHHSSSHEHRAPSSQLLPSLPSSSCWFLHFPPAQWILRSPTRCFPATAAHGQLLEPLCSLPPGPVLMLFCEAETVFPALHPAVFSS